MKKVVCLLMSCLLVLIFGLASDALAGKKKIVVANSEWSIEGTAKNYDCDGDYLGSMIGSIGMARFGGPTEVATGTVAPVMATNPEGPPLYMLVAGSMGTYNLNGYTLKKNNLISTDGNVCIQPPGLVGDPIEEYPPGACADPTLFAPMDAVMKFTKKGTFTGKVEYTLGDCDDFPESSLQVVISVSGKLLGTLPTE